MFPIKVHYLTDVNPKLASYRLRIARIIDTLLVDGGEFKFSVGQRPPIDVDIIVYGKHFNGMSDSLIIQSYPNAKHIIDLCDDYLDHPKFFSWYNFMASRVDAVVCCSQWLVDRVWALTQVKPLSPIWLIPDVATNNEPVTPMEGYKHKLVAYGRQLNLKRRLPILQEFDRALTIVSDFSPEEVREIEIHNKYIPWSDTFSCEGYNICVIPNNGCFLQDQEPHPYGKSTNRAVDALMAGCYVVTDNAMTYGALSPFIWIGDIEEGVEYALNNWDRIKKDILNAQEYIKEHHSNDVIAGHWARLFKNTVRKT